MEVNCWEKLSSRTKINIIRRANLCCSLCGWNEAQCDLHHIIHKQDGGADSIENLIVVCPNCHRKIHSLGNAFISTEELFEHSLKDLNWQKYYNPGKRWSGSRGKFKKKTYVCNWCDKSFESRAATAKYCSPVCSNAARSNPNKPSKKQLQELMNTMTWVAIGKKYGVTDNAIRKWAKGYGLI